MIEITFKQFYYVCVIKNLNTIFNVLQTERLNRCLFSCLENIDEVDDPCYIIHYIHYVNDDIYDRCCRYLEKKDFYVLDYMDE